MNVVVRQSNGRQSDDLQPSSHFPNDRIVTYLLEQRREDEEELVLKETQDPTRIAKNHTIHT